MSLNPWNHMERTHPIVSEEAMPLQFGPEGYSVERLPDPVLQFVAAGYRVLRPDGSECCTGVYWSDVEDAIREDLHRQSA